MTTTAPPPPPARRRRRLPGRAVVAALVVAALAAFVVVPIAVLLGRSLAEGPAVFLEALSSEANRRALANTFVSGAGAAALAALLGAPLGAALARLPLRGSRILDALLVLPIAVPPYVWAMAWIALASPRAGWLNQLAAAVGIGGGTGIAGAGVAPLDVYGMPGIVWVLGTSLFPLVLLPTRAALQSADPSLEEAARIAGAGPVRAFVTGSLPLAWPAAVSGTLLAFLGSISAFGVPYLLGVATERPALVATTRIYQAMALGADADLRSAIALCALLMALGAAATVAAARLGRAPAAAAGGKGRRVHPLEAPGLTRAATPIAWGIAAVAVVLPSAAIVLSALTRRFGQPPLPGNLTLAQFTTVLGMEETRHALARSAWLGVASASTIVVVGLAIAFLRRGDRFRAGTVALARLAEAPYAIPGSVLALALLLAFSQEIRFVLLDRMTIAMSLAGTLWILGIAYVLKYLAFGVRAAETAVRAIDPGLEEAARVAGSGPLRAFLDVTVPIARPALIAGWILAFLPAATELTMSVLLVGPRTGVLGTVLFELSSYADPPAAAVLACVCLALVVAAQLAVRRLDPERDARLGP